ncbi:hypothetical protein BU16DRAFT_110965 [Lophium mytilinum]|uniref:Rhodopsin domain-containing protein n=1 Tax=Lophium mytilinum TaxID=390894 RepID=A0A6A6QK03_9PEZI|nr:hypothetical protein BU16DRAFT_110965 [Lophium mytilinum]
MAPQALGPTVETTAFTLTSISTIVVATRFYCRYYVVGAIKIYDLVMLAALICTWGICTINVYQIRFGTGRHMEDQPSGDPTVLLEGTLKTWYVYQLAYLVDLSLVKFSILVFYRSIAARKVFRYVVDTTIGVVAAFTVAMVFVNAFECPKPSDAWSVEILFQGSGSCIDLHPLYYGQAAFNILSDVVILTLPIPVLMRLQMHKNKRLALVGIFSIGFIAVVASTIRVYALHVWATGTDTPYNAAYILVWSQIEINAAIVSASIPSLKPLFRHTFGGTTRNTTANYYSGRSGGSKPIGSATSAAVALKSLPSSATMTSSHTHKLYPVFGNESDEKLFCKKLTNTKGESDDDVESQRTRDQGPS